MVRRAVWGVVPAVVALTLALAGCGSSTPGAGSAASPADAAAAPLTGPHARPVAQLDAAGNTLAPLDGAYPAPAGKSSCSGKAIAFAGPVTGLNAVLGNNILNAANLAVAQHNKANPNCRVTLKQFDTGGDPEKALQLVPQIVADASILWVVGPTFSGETKATGQQFADAGLVSMTPAATNPTLTQHGWRTLLRGMADDDVQAPAVAKYLTGTAGLHKVCVVSDNTDYGAGLAKSVTAALGSAAMAGCAPQVKAGDREFPQVVSAVSAAAPDAVFYAGSYTEAAPLVKALRQGGVRAVFAAGDGSYDPQFVAAAGDAATGALLSCPCGQGADQFAADYRTAVNSTPGIYSAEGYDLASILLKGIDVGKLTRSDLLDYARSYDGSGMAHHYHWAADGELADPAVWIYRVQ